VRSEAWAPGKHSGERSIIAEATEARLVASRDGDFIFVF